MSDSSSKQLVVFSLGSEEYALTIGAVHEIIRYTEPPSVASSEPWAGGGELSPPDVALLAPGGAHLRPGADRRTALSDQAPMGGLRPRADLTIADAAALYGPRTLRDAGA